MISCSCRTLLAINLLKLIERNSMSNDFFVKTDEKSEANTEL